MDHEFKFGRFAGAIASPAGDAWRFAQDLLGKVVPSDFVLVEQQRTERAQWEWLADISTRHEGQRQKIVNSHVTAMADPEFVKWLAECTTLQEFDWDPAKHPRRGGPPNAGWFATTGGAGGTAGSGTSAGKVNGVFRGGKRDTNDEHHVAPRMLELAGA